MKKLKELFRNLKSKDKSRIVKTVIGLILVVIVFGAYQLTRGKEKRIKARDDIKKNTLKFDERTFEKTIYNDLALGHVTPETRQRYHEICARHIEEDGIDSVILGCTELPLVISSDDLPIQVLDTTEIHVGAILAAAS